MASDVKRPDRKSISKLYVSGHQIRGWFGTDHARNTTALQNVRFRHQSHTVCHTLPGVPVADPLLDPPSIVVVLAGRCCQAARDATGRVAQGGRNGHVRSPTAPAESGARARGACLCGLCIAFRVVGNRLINS